MKRFILLILIMVSFKYELHAQKFYPDDPLRKDQDCQQIPSPAEVEFSRTYNLMKNTFGTPGDPEERRAANVNTLGEVPDSTWFTNRIGRDAMTEEELLRGPNQESGPDPVQPWTIISAKFAGVTPGFVIEDNKGDRYFIKFDTKGYSQMSTSAEVISTKFFHAIGYNVPENYLTHVDREKLAISPNAMMIVDKTRKRKMTEQDIDQIYKRIAQSEGGRAQAVASRVVSGDVIGTFLFNGTRTDDANDIFPHEDRRELRGLRVFAAWLNHDEIQTFNTLDTYRSGCITHYLIDFNSTFGSANIKPNDPKSGNQYYYESHPVFKNAYTIGLWVPSWQHVQYPRYSSIGRFEADYFQPQDWKPQYPNSAFNKMRNEDAFWATKIIMQFTDDKIRKIVSTGQYEDKQAEEYLIQTLIKRRDKIIHYYLDQLNPLDGFEMNDRLELTFRNLGLNAGLASNASYQYEWFRFNNPSGSTEKISGPSSSDTSSLRIPDDHAEYLLARIRTNSEAHVNWQKTVDVYIRNDATKTVIGIDREN